MFQNSFENSAKINAVNQSIGCVLLTAQKKINPRRPEPPDSSNIPNSEDSGLYTEILHCWGVIGRWSGKSQYARLFTCIAYPNFSCVLLRYQINFNCVFSYFSWVNTQIRLLIKILLPNPNIQGFDQFNHRQVMTLA